MPISRSEEDELPGMKPEIRGINVETTAIAGCVEVHQPIHHDTRGWFTKSLSDSVRESTQIDFTATEIYWSLSKRGVVRGMHFQVPPVSVSKLVWVASGSIRDVVLDLRTDSATYSKWVDFELDPESGSVLVPHGCAHGFEVTSEEAIVFYAQDGPFSPECDAGVRWDSFGYQWLSPEPVMSDRDRGLPALGDFVSPFVQGQQ
ncbi:MAG: dTDP-4-dehydrorhamnose 3,5-epimerase family protein [Candidatus Nanopelagicales bacterium]